MTIRRFARFVIAVLAIGAVGCSDNPKAAPTKAEITVDPNVFTVEIPNCSNWRRWKRATCQLN